MEDDEIFAAIADQLKGMTSEETMAHLDVLKERWFRLSQVIQTLDMGDKDSEYAWVDGEFAERGIDLRALMLMGLRLAIAKNVPPAEFAANWVSGFIFGALNTLEEQGVHAIDEIRAKIPPSLDVAGDDDDDDYGTMEVSAVDVSVRPNPDEMLDIHSIGEHLRGTAASIGEDFDDPDEDWQPLLLASNDTDTAMVGIEIPDDHFKKEVIFTRVLPRIVRSQIPNAERVAFLTSVWTLGQIKKGSEKDRFLREKRGRISDHPDREEALVLYLMDDEGEQELWMAKINRHDDSPPTLDEWVMSDPGHTEGVVVEMLKKILK